LCQAWHSSNAVDSAFPDPAVGTVGCVTRTPIQILLVLGLLVGLAVATSTPAAAEPRASKQQIRKALKEARSAHRQAERALAAAEEALAVAQGVSSGGLADGSVTTPKIADGAVTTPKLGAGAVTAGKIGTGAVDSSSLFTPGVLDSSSLFGPGVVDTAAIAPGAVTTPNFGVIPAARVTFSTNQSIPDDFNTFTPLTWNQETFDTAAVHTGASPNLTAPVAGIYQVTSSVELNNAAAGDEDVSFWALLADGSGNAVAQAQNLTAESDGGETNWSPVDLNLTALVSLDAGETVHVEVSQYSEQPGGPIPLPIVSGDPQSSFQMAWIGPQSVAP
jgi:hypothetical protein